MGSLLAIAARSGVFTSNKHRLMVSAAFANRLGLSPKTGRRADCNIRQRRTGQTSDLMTSRRVWVLPLSWDRGVEKDEGAHVGPFSVDLALCLWPTWAGSFSWHEWSSNDRVNG